MDFETSGEYANNDSDEFSFIQEDSQFKVSYSALLQEMNDRVLIASDVSNKSSRPYNVLNEDDMNAAFIRQICIWLPISLGFVLFFTIFALVDMPVQKNSILYAKYGTTKQLQSQ